MAQCVSISNAAEALLILQSLMAGLILLVLSFTKKRVHMCSNRLKGIPGLVVPINLLRITRHRIINAVALASMSSTILSNVLLPPSLGTVENKYGQIFIDQLTVWFWALFETILYFPLFGCLNASIRWLGMLMGAIYATIMLLAAILRFVKILCPIDQQPLIQLKWLGLGIQIPIYAFLVILIVYYTVRCIQEIKKFFSKPNGSLQTIFSPHHEETDYYKQWVKELLRYKRPIDNSVLVHKYEAKVFKFSPRFFSAIFVMFVLTYQLTLLAVYLLLSLVDFFAIGVSAILTSLNATSTLHYIEKGLQALQAAAVIGPCITSIIVLCILINMVKCIRADLKRAIRGDFTCFHLPTSMNEGSPYSVPIQTPEGILSSSLQYMAYQFAYLITAWIIILFTVLGAGAAIGIIVVLFVFALNWILPKIISFIVALLIMAVMFIVQKCMCKYVFTDKTFHTSEKQLAKDTIIAHVQLYHWWAYVFFILNTFRGFLSSLLRSLCSAGIVMLLLFRMDRSVYIRGLEMFDGGYSTYVACLYLEYVQNHPIMSTFVQILCERVEWEKTVQIVETATKTLDPKSQKGYFHVSRRARNRWNVAYTLLRNPDIAGMTCSRMNEAAVEEKAANVA